MDHNRLVKGLEEIGREGLAEVILEHFGPELSFQEQVARASTVDVSESPSAFTYVADLADLRVCTRQWSDSRSLDGPGRNRL
jgi:hypothetical protein